MLILLSKSRMKLNTTVPVINWKESDVKAGGTRIQYCAKTNNIVLKISTHLNVLAVVGIRLAKVSINIKSTQTL